MARKGYDFGKNWRVDFQFRTADQKNFHKAFTFTQARSEREAKGNIIFARPGQEVEIISVTPAE